MGRALGQPGLHPSCLTFIRDNDVAVLGWDMLEAAPPHYGTDVTVHAAISSFGVVLLDNALLEPLATRVQRKTATSSC